VNMGWFRNLLGGINPAIKIRPQAAA